jgi:hypothetical protein
MGLNSFWLQVRRYFKAKESSPSPRDFYLIGLGGALALSFLKANSKVQAPVAYFYNPSYLGDRSGGS